MANEQVYYSALHYAAKAEKSASTAAEAAEIAKQLGNDRINQTHITNCITEIPQDIKLELNNGTLTLKAGSKVYVPNGFEADGVTPKFDEVVIASDIASGFISNADRDVLVYLNMNNNTLGYNTNVTETHSGASAPSGVIQYHVWYDTANNIVKMTVDKGVTWTTSYSLPIALVKLNSSSVVTSINQIFNGFGYIGSKVYALPGVKGLIPNGRNEDGSLRNVEFVNPVVRIHSINGTYSLKLCLAISGIAAYFYAYDDVENAIYRTDTGAYYPSDRLIVGDISCTNGVITSLTPKTAFHAIDYQEAALKQNFQVVSTLPSSPQPDVFYFIPE